jgi:prenyltransferase beta subunit
MLKRFSLLVVCFTACLIPARAQTADEKKATITYLQGLQTPEGGFLPATRDPNSNRVNKPSLRATSSALRALKYFGGEASDTKAAAKFVASCFDKDSGGFSDNVGGKPEVAATAIGLIAVMELELKMPESFIEPAVKFLGENAKTFEEIRIAVAGFEAVGVRSKKANDWPDQVKKLANDDGTYGKGEGKARDTGGSVVVILRLGGNLEQKEAVIKALKAGQRGDGAFGKDGTDKSDLESSYRVMRAFHMLMEKPADVDALKTFIAKCRNKDGGYGVTPGQESTVSGAYFASIILHWLDEK